MIRLKENHVDYIILEFINQNTDCILNYLKKWIQIMLSGRVDYKTDWNFIGMNIQGVFITEVTTIYNNHESSIFDATFYFDRKIGYTNTTMISKCEISDIIVMEKLIPNGVRNVKLEDL